MKFEVMAVTAAVASRINSIVFPPLRFARLHLALRPQAPLFLPLEWRGNKLRGALGEILHARECRPDCPGVAQCPHRAECAYAALFAPQISASDSAQAVLASGRPLAGMSNIPRHFLLRPPLDSEPVFGPHRPLCFELRLFGAAMAAYRFFIETFAALEAYGFTAQRVPVRLESVWTLDQRSLPHTLLWQDGVAGDALPLPLALKQYPNHQFRGHRLRIDYFTRTSIKHLGKTEQVPSLPGLVARLCDRLAALCQWAEQKPWPADLVELKRLAHAGEIAEIRGGWELAERTSTRTGETMDLSGFRGSVLYHHVAPELAPLLAWGQEIHAGRAAVWGNGWYRPHLPALDTFQSNS